MILCHKAATCYVLTFSGTRSKTEFPMVQICCVAVFKSTVHKAQTLKTLFGVTAAGGFAELVSSLRDITCFRLKMKFQRNILNYATAKASSIVERLMN